ncbi:KRI1-like family C-terminal-domain-containing protein [Hyaloraphidium curvatum]|nr:KRI1-like family C-terminal-domain-containing protein [Hyaloraphidium curvatum]
MPNLLEDDDELQLKVNPEFARKYEERKKREELSQLRDKYEHGSGSEEDSEEDEEEDEFGELVTPAVDAQIVQTIALIRKRDPAVYDSQKKFFDEAELEKARQEWERKQKKLKAEGKPVRLKDVHRERLLAGQGSDNEEESRPLTHAEEQEKLKRELKAAMLEDAEEGGEDSLFTVRRKTEKDLEDEEEDYKNFLLEKIGRNSKEGEIAIRDWTTRKGENEEVDANEKFLWDYILNRGWVDKEANRVPGYSEIVDDDEDEEHLEEAEEFERQYNFRYEEEGGANIVGHARNIDSVRRKDDKRKREREAKAQRQEEERRQKEEELKRLKNLKKAEILEKLKKIQQISGSKSIPFADIDLEGDFDPTKYDEQMAEAFGEDYYVEEDPDGKPVFEDDIDISDLPAAAEGGAGEGEDADANGAGEAKKKRKKKKKKTQGAQQEDQFVMDADYLESGAAGSERAGAAPKDEVKQALNRYLEESYQLDFEDVVGGIPTRFKYRTVQPESFGLDPVDILLADEKDLNELVSLKKLAPFRSAEKQRRDAEKWKREKKRKLQEFRKKLDARMAESGGQKPVRDSGKPKKRKHDDAALEEERGGKKARKGKEHSSAGNGAPRAKSDSKDGKARKHKDDHRPGKPPSASDNVAAGNGDEPFGAGDLAPEPGLKIKKPKKPKAAATISEARLQTYLSTGKQT